MPQQHHTQQASSTTASTPRAPAIDPLVRLRARCQAGKAHGVKRAESRLKHHAIREGRARAAQQGAE